MSLHDRWIEERHHEHYYKLAKKMNYRSRASFKIMQMDDRFGIFKEGDSVEMYFDGKLRFRTLNKKVSTEKS